MLHAKSGPDLWLNFLLNLYLIIFLGLLKTVSLFLDVFREAEVAPKDTLQNAKLSILEVAVLLTISL